MDWRTSSHLKYENFQGYRRTYPVSMSGMNNVQFNHMQAKPQANFPVPNHHISESGFTSPSKMNNSSQQDQVIGVVAASFCSIRVEGQTVPFVGFKKNPEVYELHQLISSGIPFIESEDYRSMINLLPQERVTFPQPSSDSKPMYRMKPHILNPEAEEYIPKTVRQTKQNGEMISSPSCSSDGTNTLVDDVTTNGLLASQSYYSSRFSPVTENISQNSSEASKEATREIQSHNLQDVNTNSSLKMDEDLSNDYKLEENKPTVCKGNNVETDNSSSQKLSCSLSESVPPNKLNISHNSSLAFESQHGSVCNSTSSDKDILANTYNALHTNSLTSDMKNEESNSPVDSNSEGSDNDEKKQSDGGSDIDSDSDSEDTDSQCSEESDSDDSICFDCQSDDEAETKEDTKCCHEDSFICFENVDADDSLCESDDDEAETKEDTKFCLDDSFICFENVDADDSLCESDNEEESQNEDEDKCKCLNNGNVTDGFEDSICFEALVDNNELIDAQSNITQKDNKLITSDIDNPSEEEEDCDYDCDLFKVELSNNEWDLQLGGLEISNLVSQCIWPSETPGSPNNDDLFNDDIFDEVDCCPNLALVNEEVVEANRRWNVDIDSDYRGSTSQKVKFCDNVEIHLADDWCRKGPWEECARDRMRFRRRIEETEAVLSPVFTSEHRCKVLRALISACK